jgi:hypothetical protein
VKRTSVIRYTRPLADDAEAIIAPAEAEGLTGAGGAHPVEAGRATGGGTVVES